MARPLGLTSIKNLSKVTKLITSNYTRDCKIKCQCGQVAEHRTTQTPYLGAAIPLPLALSRAAEGLEKLTICNGGNQLNYMY